jgi:hypothetical protein
LYQEKSGSPVHEFKTRQKSSLNWPTKFCLLLFFNALSYSL